MEDKNEWKGKTCETCTFQVYGYCKESPPFNINMECTWIFQYPRVFIDHMSSKFRWCDACSKWEPEE